MNVDDQLRVLVKLGRRLDLWSVPGDAEDYLLEPGGTPLWNEYALKWMPRPSRIVDVILGRWFHVKDFASKQPVAFLANPAQREFSRSRAAENIVAKSGRAGFTAREMLRALVKTMCNPGYTAVLVAHHQKYAQDYFLEARFSFEMFGENVGNMFRAGALNTGKSNVREIYFPAINSHFFVDTAGQFAPAEGQSISYLICDEMARWRVGDPKQVIATLVSHVTGDDTEITMMSRPFGQDGDFYERYWSARRGESSFKAHFFEWWWNPAQIAKVPADFKLEDDEPELCEKYRRWRADPARKECGLTTELQPAQVMWRRNQKKKLRDLFGQEFAEDQNACFIGSGNCPFSGTTIAAVLKDRTPIIERQSGAGETENGLIRWFEPDPNEWYVLFVDPAGALFTSRIAMQLIKGSNGEQAAEWVGRTDAESIGGIVARIARLYKRVIIVVESNLGRVSATVMATLTGEQYKFNGDPEAWPRLYKERDSGGQWNYGWYTDPKNRPLMLDRFGDIWAEHPELFHSSRLVTEVQNCQRKGDRIGPKKGMTDDLVMAMAGAQIVRPTIKVVQPQPNIEIISVRTAATRDERGWERI